MKRTSNIILLSIVAFCSILYILALNPNVAGEMYDDARFIVFAKSLVEGKPFYGHTTIGFPILLTSIIKLFPVFPQNIIFLKIISLIMSILFLISIYIFLVKCQFTGRKFALLVVFFTGINYKVLEFSVQIMSEMSYAFFSMGALLFIELYLLKNDAESKRNKSHVFLFFIAGIFGTLAFHTRMIGLSFILAVMIYFFIRRDIKKGFFFAILSLILASFWLCHAYRYKNISDLFPIFLTKNLDYLEIGKTFPLTLISQFGINLWNYYTECIADIIFPFLTSKLFLNILVRVKMPYLWRVFQFICSSIAFLGFLQYIKKFRVLTLYIIIYTIVLLSWPYLSKRFLIPITPFIIYYFLLGMRIIISKIKFAKSWKYMFLGLLLGLISISALKRNSEYIYNVHKFGHRMGEKASIIWREKMEAFDWIKRTTSKDVVLASGYLYSVNLYTGRETLWAPHNINNMLKFNYLILMSPQAMDISCNEYWRSHGLQIFERYPQRFKQVFKTSSVSIWEICKFPETNPLPR